MERVNCILKSNDYQFNLNKNIEAEAERIFCKHDITHFLDVARIAYIINLEEQLGFKKDIIYAAALLHDIGKWKQYIDQIPHSIHSAKIAQHILPQCGYNEDEIRIIVEGIINHQGYTIEDKSFCRLIYTGDKKSRKCFDCSAQSLCNWESEKKNNNLII